VQRPMTKRSLNNDPTLRKSQIESDAMYVDA
jgi:hypothetical protein